MSPSCPASTCQTSKHAPRMHLEEQNALKCRPAGSLLSPGSRSTHWHPRVAWAQSPGRGRAYLALTSPKAGRASKQRQKRHRFERVSAQLILTRTGQPLKLAFGAGKDKHTPGWLICSSAQCQPTPGGPGTGAAVPHGSLGTRTSLVQPEGNATIHLPANTFKHHSTPLQQRRLIFFFLAECSYVYYVFLSQLQQSPLGLHFPRKKTNPKAQSVPCKSPGSGVPLRRGTRWSQQPARLSPALLVDICSTVYFFKQRSLCIQCIVARGFVFKA